MPSADVLKENKGQKPNLNKHTTNMPSIFGKKDGGGSSGYSSIRKKGKVLCDVVPSSSSSSAPTTSTLAATVKFSETLTLPIPPTKRPKVSASKKNLVHEPIVSTAFGTKDDLGSSRFAIDNNVPQTRQLSTTNVPATLCQEINELPLFYSKDPNTSLDMKKITQKFSETIDADLDKPCCSTSIVRNTATFQKTIKKTSSFAGVSAGPSSLSGLTATPIFHAKKTSTKVRLKFSGVGSSLLKQLKRGGGPINKEAIKLKKKKNLKSEANTKRKKAKVF